MAVSKKVSDRLVSQIKRYQSILSEAKNRDISESDTVIIIAEMLADVFGYKKFLEITTEHSIRGTYVDLCVKVGNDVRFLVEAKAIGVNLKDAHVKQAIDYGANQGVEWVALTTGIVWQIYKILFKQPIDKVLVCELDLLTTNPRNPQMIECLANLTREGFSQSGMAAFCQQQQVTSRFSLAAILLGSAMIHALRRELRRISPSLRIDEETLRNILQADVLKREVVDSDEAKQAADFLKKASRQAVKSKLKPCATTALQAQSCAEVPTPDGAGTSGE